MQALEDAREHTTAVPLAQHEHATGTVFVRVAGRGEDSANPCVKAYSH
jgi:hypothetical protein